MPKIKLITFKTIRFDAPNPESKRDRLSQKDKFLGFDEIAINIKMIVSLAPAKEMEIEGKISSTTNIILIDDTYLRVAESFNSLVDRLMHS